MGRRAGRLTGKRQSPQAGSSSPCSSPWLVQVVAGQRRGDTRLARAPGRHFRFRPSRSRGEAAPLPSPVWAATLGRRRRAPAHTRASCPPGWARPWPLPSAAANPATFLSPRAPGVAQGGTWVTGSGCCERRRPGRRGSKRRRGRRDARMESAGRRSAHRRLTGTHGFCRARAVQNRLASPGGGT